MKQPDEESEESEEEKTYKSVSILLFLGFFQYRPQVQD